MRCGSFALVVVAGMILEFGGTPRHEPHAEGFAIVLGTCLLVFCLMYMVLVGTLAGRFGEQAAIARAGWAAMEFSSGPPQS